MQPPSSIPRHRFEQSLSRYDQNNLIAYLQKLSSKDTALQLAALYHLGTSHKQPGACIFWQVDATGQVRTGKVVQHDSATGKRIAQTATAWVHNALDLPGYHLRQCLFGEHLLARYPDKPLRIVLREETAIVCSLVQPQYVWLALGEIGNLSAERFEPLRGRAVELFPDLGDFEQWQALAQQIPEPLRPTVLDDLERNAPATAQPGYGLADVLVVPDQDTGHALSVGGYPVFWDENLTFEEIYRTTRHT